MADLLPNNIVLQPIINKGYAFYSTKSASKFINTQCLDVFDPYTKIEVEIAKKHRNYVHLRFYHSNRYWARSEVDNDNSIVADSKHPEENASISSCTMFEPTLDSNNQIRFTHVQSGRRVRTDPNTTRIYVDDKGHGADGDYAFSFVDWDTLVKIPKHVSFKGDNGKYLQAYTYENKPYNQFSSSDGNHENALYEVDLNPDGHLRIKSVHYGKFLSWFGADWIIGDTASHDKHDGKYDLFWPVRIDGQTIALRNTFNGKFCTRYTDDYGKNDFLNASNRTITNEAHLVVQELVLERSIYNVEYRMDDARVYDEQPFLAGTGDAVNQSDRESSIAINISYQHTQSTCYTCSVSLTLGFRASIEAGIPEIVDGKLEISASLTFSFQWQSTSTEQITAQATYMATVPPRSRVRVNYMATQGKSSVPFSYTQRDMSSTDGKVSISRNVDGVFLGSNCYNFHFVELPIEPL